MCTAADRDFILAIYNNVTDEAAFRPLLSGLHGLLSLRNPPGKKLLTEKMALLQLRPALVILSGRLYPESRPELVAELKGLYPGVEILLVCLATDPLPPLQQLACDRVRHLLVTSTVDGQEGVSSLREAINKLLVRTPWTLPDHVRPGSRVHEFSLTSSRQKEALIATVDAAIGGDSPAMELLRQRAALLVDEMVENALYGAPQGEDGRKLYRKGEERAIAADEMIIFRFAFDGETLAMEIADGWGTLSPDLVIDYLAKNLATDQLDDDTGGRGLFIIWRFLDHFHVNIRPGHQTVLGGHIKATAAPDFEAPKGFFISTQQH